MINSSLLFRVGSRNSKLARLQTGIAVRCFQSFLPDLAFDVVAFSTPGDRDLQTDLRESSPDFFTRDLDDAVREGTLDCAVHSAKDLPDVLPEGLRCFYLPCREDPEDALVLADGQQEMASLGEDARIGVSSERRHAWCRQTFPKARLLPIRGSIEQRLELLDNGKFDAVVMAKAALFRLGLSHRISHTIPKDALAIPEGQGILAVTHRQHDPRMLALRDLFVKTVVFAGAGVGRVGTCTQETLDALRRADVCLHDTLLDDGLLKHLPSQARVEDVGKRCGERGAGQQRINDKLVRYATMGLRVVRLKGGDPGVFGRLAEEVDALEKESLPFRVLPGISSLQLASTGTGLLLTRRGEARGFSVLTPRSDGGSLCSIGKEVRASLPQVYFMATTAARDVFQERLAEGAPPETPVVVVYEAGSPNETLWQSTLASAVEQCPPVQSPPIPGLIFIGVEPRLFRKDHGALQGRRVLLTCSEALQQEACARIADAGGVPIPFPVISLETVEDSLDAVLTQRRHDWWVLTSPSAVHATMEILKGRNVDVRSLPLIMVCGQGTAKALRGYGITPDAVPSHGFGSDALVTLSQERILPGQRVLRLRSDAAGKSLSKRLTALGFSVTDQVVIKNQVNAQPALPCFDAVFFASRSAVCALLDREDAPDLSGRLVVAIGLPTAAELERRGVKRVLMGKEATVRAALLALTGEVCRQRLTAVPT